MKVFLTLLVFLISINAYVYHRERALEITVDSDGNGFYCFVLTGGKGDNNGTAYIRKYLFPPKSGASPFIKYEDVLVPGVNVVKGCTVTTYNQSGQMYLLATFETSPLSFTMMHVPYTADPITTVPVFGTMNLWTLVQENTPYSFAGIWNMPQLFNLNGSIILIFMGTETTVSDFRVCYYYYSNLSAWMTNSYRLVNTPAQSIFGYKYGNQDYFSAYVQNGVIKLSIAQNRYPYGTCAVATCITGLVFHEINSSGYITNSTFKTLPNLNLGADSSRPMPGETYHNATSDNYGGVFSNFLSYESFIFTYSCSWNRTENRCYWLASAVALTQKAPVLANDALIYNNSWWVVFIDEGWTIKLYTIPTYWTANTNYYGPRTLLIGNVSTALNSTMSLSSDYFERSELSFFQYFSSLGTKIYLTFVNSSYDADIIPILY